MRRRNWLVPVLVFLIPAIGISSAWVHDRDVASGFKIVTLGMPRAQVTELLGRPRSVTRCDAPGPFQWTEHANCAEAYLYPSWGQPLIPREWVVWFDASGTAIGKYCFVSW